MYKKHDISPRFIRTKDLLLDGHSRRQIEKMVSARQLIKLRKGVYASLDTPEDCLIAVQSRGKLTCISELRRLGIFAFYDGGVHIQQDPSHTLVESRRGNAAKSRRRHWVSLRRQPHPRAMTVDPLDALGHSARCQEPRMFLASVDSALRQRLIHPDDVEDLFSSLPLRLRYLHPLINPNAESGPESLMRLILLRLRVPFELQVLITGVGRVDFLVGGRLIVECDSRAFHEMGQQQQEDRRRDLAAAAQGLHTFRVMATTLLEHPTQVESSLRALLAHVRF